MTLERTVYYGAIINPQSLAAYEASPSCLIGVSETGVIEWITRDVDDTTVHRITAENGYSDSHLVVLKHGEFLMPGFVDTHTHAPQFPNMGSGQQYQLLDWLKYVTFPTEAKFSDPKFAKPTYQSVVRRIINCGTTTCCYYGTLHVEATKILADVVHEQGQRAFVGKCNMDRNSPDDYIEPSPEASLEGTKAIIQHIRSLGVSNAKNDSSIPDPGHAPRLPSLVSPILTPRFAISCTDALLTQLGALAASDPALAIQTHISENHAEVDYTRELFPACSSYADVYDHFGLLRSNTILAHAVHLEPAELDLVRVRAAGVSHCPTSNFNLSSGVACVGKMLDLGIKVGLGTDVSGGFSPSILTAIQHASIASKIIAMESTSPSLPSPPAPLPSNDHNRDQAPAPATSMPTTAPARHDPTFAGRALPVSALLHLATLGGAQVCSLDAHVGSFVPGKAFDALCVSMRAGQRGTPGLWDADVGDGPSGPRSSVRGASGGAGGSAEAVDAGRALLERYLERFLFCGDDRNILRVYVQGRLVGGANFGSKFST